MHLASFTSNSISSGLSLLFSWSFDNTFLTISSCIESGLLISCHLGLYVCLSYIHAFSFFYQIISLTDLVPKCIWWNSYLLQVLCKRHRSDNFSSKSDFPVFIFLICNWKYVWICLILVVGFFLFFQVFSTEWLTGWSNALLVYCRIQANSRPPICLLGYDC